jgi:hypothetical protein
MALVSVFACEDMPVGETLAAVRVHGFFNTMKEARQSIEEFASEQSDVQSYIIEECMHWLTVEEPVKGTGVEEEEIRAPENDDRENGRMGSVCDLRRSPQTNDDKVTIFENTDKPKSKAWQEKEVRSRRQQLDDLLGGNTRPTITSPEQYATAREQLALLCAFRRKLHTMCEDGERKCTAATEQSRALQEKFPEYRQQFLEKYRNALKQSGIREDDVAFMEFLTEDL